MNQPSERLQAVHRWDVRDSEYHADHGVVGHSMLVDFRDNRPRYHGLYVDHAIPIPDPSEAMIFGSGFHAMARGREAFHERFAVCPVCDGRTKEGKAIRARFQEQSAGKTVIDDQSFCRLLRMREALLLHPIARPLFDSPGMTEQAFRWVDSDTGLTLKLMVDKLLVLGRCEYPVIIDLKSVGSSTGKPPDLTEEGFGRTCWNYGYDIQHALYSEGIELLFGVAPLFLWVCVGKEPPYEVRVHRMSDDDAFEAKLYTRGLLRQLAECYATGDFSQPGSNEIRPVTRPKWVNYRETL